MGYPWVIRIDNGPEFVSRDLDLWAYQRGVTLDFSRSGTPTDDTFAESFNGKVPAECLNTAWFMSLDDARSECEARCRDYNGTASPQRDRRQAPDCAHERRRAIRPARRLTGEKSRPDLLQGWGQGLEFGCDLVGL